MKPKTALQQYADWLALRDNSKEIFTTTISETVFVAIRNPIQPLTPTNPPQNEGPKTDPQK